MRHFQPPMRWLQPMLYAQTSNVLDSVALTLSRFFLQPNAFSESVDAHTSNSIARLHQPDPGTLPPTPCRIRRIAHLSVSADVFPTNS